MIGSQRSGQRIGRVHGAEEQTYTAGVICAKVARYAERIHHKDRLLYPQKREDLFVAVHEQIMTETAAATINTSRSAPS